MDKFLWYLNRLRCMSISEIVSRVFVVIRIRCESVGLFRANPKLSLIAENQSNTFFAPISCHSEVVKQSNRLLQGELPVFSIDNVHLNRNFEWNRDPLTKVLAPLTFGKSLNYRDESVAGNIKYLWEPSRHLQLVTLAVAYADTGESHYLEEIQRQLEEWFEQCPYPQGPHWVSSLELGIRLINWSIVWGLIGGDSAKVFESDAGAAFKERWLTCIFQHVHFINSYYSGHSSANNHLIGEAAGVYVAAKTWPLWTGFSEWGSNAKKILEEQAVQQNYSDGVNKEQAISYQQFVLDFLIVPLLISRQTNDKFSQAYVDTVEHMLEYLQSLMDSNNNIPMIGDADDGYVFRLLWDDEFCPYSSLLATGAVLFNRGDFKKSAGKFDDKSALLLGENARSEFEGLKSEKVIKRCIFSEAGYYILGDEYETDNEYQIVVDAGPLGLGGIAAHGHSDALSFWMSSKGREFLVDPGTFAYHTEKKWRDYFRGTSAHNTLRIDGQDQSQIGGNFMWLQKANATCELLSHTDSQDRLIVSHDGYLKLPDPVNHIREFSLDKEARRLIVIDKLICNGEHIVEQFWHLSEDCQIEPVEHGYKIHNAGVEITMILDKKLGEQVVFRGDSDLPLGWISRRFDVKKATTTLRATTSIQGDVELTTYIDL